MADRRESRASRINGTCTFIPTASSMKYEMDKYRQLQKNGSFAGISSHGMVSSQARSSRMPKLGCWFCKLVAIQCEIS